MTFSLLITETVRIFRERWAPLLSLSLGLMFFSALMRGIFFGEGFFHSLALPGENTALLVASVLLMLAVHILTAGAVLRVITEGDSAASPRNALAYAWGRRGDLFSLFFLNFLLGGAYALFIIPGIIFQVWFSLSVIVLIAEGRSGTEALLASREYVRGHDWAVFSRIGFLVFFALLISSAADLLPLPSPVRQGLTFVIVSTTLSSIMEKGSTNIPHTGALPRTSRSACSDGPSSLFLVLSSSCRSRATEKEAACLTAC